MGWVTTLFNLLRQSHEGNSQDVDEGGAGVPKAPDDPTPSQCFVCHEPARSPLSQMAIACRAHTWSLEDGQALEDAMHSEPRLHTIR